MGVIQFCATVGEDTGPLRTGFLHSLDPREGGPPHDDGEPGICLGGEKDGLFFSKRSGTVETVLAIDLGPVFNVQGEQLYSQETKKERGETQEKETRDAAD